MNKRRICIIIAVVVTICAVVSALSTLRMVLIANSYGEAVPMGMVFTTILTFCCALMIWKGVREMKDE